MNKIKGVNLGGWLVLEKWMTTELFRKTKADDEYYLAHDLDPMIYEDRINMHRKYFINESDIARMKAQGVTHIRVPVPYFIFGDRKPFISCIENLDELFNWADFYGLKVLLDMHSVAYSQNAFDNGGLSGVCKWASIEEEVNFVEDLLVKLGKRYRDRKSFWGIEVLNEPATTAIWDTMNPIKRFPPRDKEMSKGSAPISFDFLYDFYKRTYNKLRDVIKEETYIVFHDGFSLDKWKSFFKENEFKNVILDTHQYIMTAELEGIDLSLEAYSNYLDNLKNKLEKVSGYVKLIVGEWSLFNSYAIGIDTNGGLNPNQVNYDDINKLDKNKVKTIYQALWNKSKEAWSVTEGDFYWTYKLNIDTINNPSWHGWDSWDFDRCVSKGWISSEETNEN